MSAINDIQTVTAAVLEGAGLSLRIHTRTRWADTISGIMLLHSPENAEVPAIRSITILRAGVNVAATMRRRDGNEYADLYAHAVEMQLMLAYDDDADTETEFHGIIDAICALFESEATRTAFGAAGFVTTPVQAPSIGMQPISPDGGPYVHLARLRFTCNEL